MIQFTKEEFTAYFKKHKITPEEFYTKYVEENPKDTYVYEDVDACYQQYINHITSLDYARSGVAHNAVKIPNSGGTRTVNGVAYTTSCP